MRTFAAALLLLALAASPASAASDVISVSPAKDVCYEAHLPSHPKCKGYVEAGYICHGEYCSAENPSGHPGICATEHKGQVVDPSTGRCVAAASTGPAAKGAAKHKEIEALKGSIKTNEAATKADEAKLAALEKGSKSSKHHGAGGKNGTKKEEPEEEEELALFALPPSIDIGLVCGFLIGIVLFTIAFEKALEWVEEQLEEYDLKFDESYLEMLQKIKDELMILGFVSFNLTLLEEILEGKIDETKSRLFEFAHLLVFFIAVFLIIFSIQIMLISKRTRKSWDIADNYDLGDLLKDYHRDEKKWWYKWSSTRQRVEHKICRYCFINAHEQPFRLVGEHENEVRHMDFHPDFPHGMPDPKHEEEMPEYATQSEVHGILDMDFDFGLYLKYTLNLNMLEYLEVDWKSWMAMVGTCAVFWIVSIIKSTTKSGPGLMKDGSPVGDSVIPFTVFAWCVFFLCLALYIISMKRKKKFLNNIDIDNDLDDEDVALVLRELQQKDNELHSGVGGNGDAGEQKSASGYRADGHVEMYDMNADEAGEASKGFLENGTENVLTFMGEKEVEALEALLGVMLLLNCFYMAFMSMYHAHACIETYGGMYGGGILIMMMLPAVLMIFWLMPATMNEFIFVIALAKVNPHVIHKAKTRMEKDKNEKNHLAQRFIGQLLPSEITQNIKREWDKVNKPNEKGELDDSLDGEELVALLKGFLPGLDVKSKRFKFLKAHADPDGDGCSFDEFKAFCIATPELRNVVTKGAPGVVLMKNIRAEFDKVDSDNSGNIDMKEFTQMLFGIMPELRRTPERVYHLLRVVDPDQSGEISFEEFQSNILGLDKQ